MKTCTHCHAEKELSEYGPSKLAKDGLQTQCRPCLAEKQRAYRAKNLESQREATRKWREGAKEHEQSYRKSYQLENREARIAACRDWREKNPEKNRQAQRNYRDNNKGKVAAKNAKRYAAKMERTVGWADLEAIDAIYDQASHLTATTGIKHHVDHIIPMQGEMVSGLHVETNLQILTASENCAKGNTYRIQSK